VRPIEDGCTRLHLAIIILYSIHCSRVEVARENEKACKRELTSIEKGEAGILGEYNAMAVTVRLESESHQT